MFQKFVCFSLLGYWNVVLYAFHNKKFINFKFLYPEWPVLPSSNGSDLNFLYRLQAMSHFILDEWFVRCVNLTLRTRCPWVSVFSSEDRCVICTVQITVPLITMSGLMPSDSGDPNWLEQSVYKSPNPFLGALSAVSSVSFDLSVWVPCWQIPVNGILLKGPYWSCRYLTLSFSFWSLYL